VDQTLKVLGLKKCENTVVGNALLRGISGGEKKRLTTAEMMGAFKICLYLTSSGPIFLLLLLLSSSTSIT